MLYSGGSDTMAESAGARGMTHSSSKPVRRVSPLTLLPSFSEQDWLKLPCWGFVGLVWYIPYGLEFASSSVILSLLL